MAVSFTYGGLDLNDGDTYTLLEPVNLGERVKTWNEYRGYGGGVVQTNVHEAALIEMNFQVEVHAASLAALNAAIAAINALIDAGAQTLVWNDGTGNVSYSCVHSPRVKKLFDVRAEVGFWTIVDLILNRLP